MKSESYIDIHKEREKEVIVGHDSKEDKTRRSGAVEMFQRFDRTEKEKRK
ncbi:hypothetical protein LQ247_08880 [Bacillus sp. BS3(2021)]|nr:MULTISPECIES: hypothetical protein [Bacillus]MCD2368734.1 hypothetical protein [Bacillus sp. BS3(2021)]MCJ8230127.1 hypothetical protein [Bacillus paralicheniformis]